MSSPADASMPNPADTSVGNRFAHYTPDNHSATVWISSLLGLIYASLSLLVRLYVKRKVLSWDDWLITASTAAGLIQFILIFEALENGLGKRAGLVLDLSSISKLVFSSRVLLIASLYLSKCSGVLLIRRIFIRDNRVQGLICDTSLGFIAVCGTVSLLASSIGCPSSAFFLQQCAGQILRWRIVTGLDIITEVILLALPAYFVWRLQMKTTRKMKVVVAFYFRIIMIVFSVLHLVTLVAYTHGIPSPFRIVPVLIWQQCLVAWSIISATIPNLKAFVQSLSTNWGVDLFGYGTYSNAYGSNNYGGNSFHMKSLKHGTLSHGDNRQAFPRPDHGQMFTVQISSTARETERGSVGSGGSQDLIIRKDTFFNVESSSAARSP